MCKLRKPICDIVFCVMSFLFRCFDFLLSCFEFLVNAFCTMLFILNGAIREVETRYRRKDGRKTKL